MKPIAYLLPLLGAFFLLSSQSAGALSCAQAPFEKQVALSSTVFEGRLVKIERRFQNTQKDAGFHLEKATVIVDKPFKGSVKTGDKITVIQQVWLSVADNAKDWPEKEGEESKGIFTLTPIDAETVGVKDMKGYIYYVGMCGTLMNDSTPETIKIIQDSISAHAQ